MLIEGIGVIALILLVTYNTYYFNNFYKHQVTFVHTIIVFILCCLLIDTYRNMKFITNYTAQVGMFFFVIIMISELMMFFIYHLCGGEEYEKNYYEYNRIFFLIFYIMRSILLIIGILCLVLKFIIKIIYN
jgi:hypothetical protein